MSRQIYLHIPEPCHENWEAMSPAAQGRFCQSCSKQVVDFSRMTDTQILDVLSKAAGKTCGRFSGTQLERPIIKEIPFLLKPQKLFLSAFIPAFILSSTVACQETTKGKIVADKKASCSTLVGDTVVSTVSTENMMGTPAVLAAGADKISGRILFENGSEVADASVTIKGTKTGTISNATGNFSLQFPADQQKVILEVSYVGYKTKEITIKKKDLNPFEIKLKEEDVAVTAMILPEIIEENYNGEPNQNKPAKEVTIRGKVVNKNDEPLPYATVLIKSYKKNIVTDSAGHFSFVVKEKSTKADIVATHTGYQETTSNFNLKKDNLNSIKLVLEPKNELEAVTVSSYSNKQLIVIAGGISRVRTVAIKDTVKTFIQKLFNNEMFKAFPNPVVKGQNINLTFKKGGDYAIQLFDNSGRLYMEKELKFESLNQISSFGLPANIGSGVYYLKAINTSEKKQFIDKIIVQ